MALKSTVFKVQLQIADMDRGYYQDHSLTLAQHPSENNERMMVRLLAFIMNASDNLTFSKGLSVEDEPELCIKNLSDEIDLWIAFGQSDEKWLRKASNRAKQVQLFTYAGRSVPIWWQQNQQALERYRNLSVWNIPEESVTELGQMVARKMSLQCNINESQIWLSDATSSVMVEPVLLKDFAEK
jgi:uncharacterized protein YaeQ